MPHMYRGARDKKSNIGHRAQLKEERVETFRARCLSLTTWSLQAFKFKDNPYRRSGNILAGYRQEGIALTEKVEWRRVSRGEITRGDELRNSVGADGLVFKGQGHGQGSALDVWRLACGLSTVEVSLSVG